MNEVDRNLFDAMSVARNVLLEPRLVPGGGASEMAVSQVRICIIIKLKLNFLLLS